MASALKIILRDMDNFISNTIPRVSNPTRPEEDFADKWYLPSHKHLKLEENFKQWLMMARRDFSSIIGNEDGNFDSVFVSEKMSIPLTESTKIGITLGLVTSDIFTNEFYIKKEETAKPWRKF